MKYVFISLLLLLNNCSKPKTVLICGDHICVNKAEAQQYFEENLFKCCRPGKVNGHWAG